MKSHTLKSVTTHFENLLNGNKPFDIRRDDRGYEEGDVLHLREYDGDDYTGRQSLYVVTYAEETTDGYVVMAVKPWAPCSWKLRSVGSYYAIDSEDRLLARVYQVGEAPEDRWRVEVLNKHIDTLRNPHEAKLVGELELFEKGMYDHE